MSIRVAIFDDNANVVNSIKLLLKSDATFEVVGTFDNTANCVAKVFSSRPDLVLMDIEINGHNCIEAVHLLVTEFPNIQILIQTIYEDDERVFGSICAGASGYILKSQLTSSLIEAMKELLIGGAPMSPSIARRVLNLLQQKHLEKCRQLKEDYNLTPREKEVLTAIVKGLSYKMIGYELHISYETVRTHIRKIYQKLHVASLAEVVAKAITQHIV